jgi:hypothetical protein
MNDEEIEEEYSLTDEDKEIISALSESDIKKIDEWLLLSTTNKWKKVAMVVAQAIELSDQAGVLLEVPDTFFGMRVEKLVQDGHLISQGNLKKMRSSEIKRVK